MNTAFRRTLLFAALALFPTVAWADVPRLIHYQGKLVTTAGGFVPGPVDVRVKLYGHATNATPLYLDETHANVQLTNGLFSILIGSVAPGGVPDSAFAAAQRWLEVTIGTTTLSPRIRVAAAPYSTKARSAEQIVRPDTNQTALSADSTGSIGVGTSSPDTTALLDLVSSSKGLLVPRLTTAQRDAIPSPAEGLLIYNTSSHCFNTWTGSTWKQSCFDCAFTPPTAANNGPICAGSTLNLSATSILGATYAWTGPNGFTSNVQNPSVPNAPTAASGPYSVLATVAGCTSNPITTLATVNAIPTSPTIGSNSPLCAGQTLNLSSTSVPGALYSWTGPAGFTSNSQNPSIANVTATNAGTYTLNLSVSGCAASPVTTSVAINAVPATPGTITGLATVCSNQSGLLYSITEVTGATVYTWTAPSGATVTAGQGTAFATITFGTTSGNVSVTAGNSCGTSAPATKAVTVQGGGGGTQTFNATGSGRTGSVQTFTVPTCVFSLTVEAWGAGSGVNTCAGNPGKGARMRGAFAVNPGEVYNVVVGQRGNDTSVNCANGGGGGGGGSFIWLNGATTPILVAGGGGASSLTNNGSPRYFGTDASTSEPGTASRSGQAGGSGGNDAPSASGGRGWNTVRTNASGVSLGCGTYTADGGFGGGGAGQGCHVAGGGGGYSGGGADGSNYDGGGGGGGSYNAGSNPSNSSGVQLNNGQVVFTW